MVLGGDFTEIATWKVIVGSGLGNDYDGDIVEMILDACSLKRLQLLQHVFKLSSESDA